MQKNNSTQSSLDYALFTDGSLNPQHKLGIGVYLLFPGSLLEKPLSDNGIIKLSEQLKKKKFEDVSSTKLEIETVLWALGDCLELFKNNKLHRLTLYTDSQCVDGLLKRRANLEDNEFISKSKNLPHKNTALYREFYSLYDKLEFEVIKVKGHSPSRYHNEIQRIFSMVDKAARRKLKEIVSKNS